jgi:hypothetical protein
MLSPRLMRKSVPKKVSQWQMWEAHERGSADVSPAQIDRA